MADALKSVALFPLRAVVFAVGYVDYHFERAADWLVGATNSTEYVREGSCVRCGRCCALLGIEMPEWVVRRRWLVKFLRAWHSAGLNFEYQGETERMLAYRCRYYGDGKGCSVYPFRHRLCRYFPRQRLYGRPRLHDECGFSFVRREVAGRRRKLAKTGGSDFSRALSEAKGDGPRPA